MLLDAHCLAGKDGKPDLRTLDADAKPFVVQLTRAINQLDRAIDYAGQL